MKQSFLFILFCVITFTVVASNTTFEKGINALELKQYSTAQSIFQKLTDEQPNYANYYNLGIASGKLKQWRKAKWAFESALKYKPKDKDGQYNATFSTQQLNKDVDWNNPYSWYIRFFLVIGYSIWIVFSIISSILLGYVIYLFFRSKFSFNQLIKGSHFYIGVISLFLFLLSYFAIVKINRHFSENKFAIINTPKASFYISPNGVKTNPTLDLAKRFNIKKYSSDKKWLQIEYGDGHFLWLKQTDAFIY